MTSLKPKDIEDFWIRVYLNPKGNLIEASADRAYRDLNRTLRGLGKEQSIEKYKHIRSLVINLSQDLISFDPMNQSSFDNLHRQKCEDLIKGFNIQYENIRMTVGQAQKWINMYLKYLFVLGESRIPSINRNYQYFHIPVDNIIQEALVARESIERIKGAWSRINDYDVYLDYQKRIRKAFKDKTPMDVEFKVFNETPSI